MTEVPKPPLATTSRISAMQASYLSRQLLSRIIWVFAVRAPPGIGLKMISGETCMDSGGMKYFFRQFLKIFSTPRIFSGSMSRVYSVPRSLWNMVRMSASQVPPERGAMARSMTSAPASMAAMLQATAMPAVSWVWNWISLSLPMRARACLMVS